MDERAFTCIAQIAGNGGVKGAGFLVPGGYVITCAHVVNQALGRRNESAERPNATEQTRVAFPWSNDGQRVHDGYVAAWFPLPATRIAGEGRIDIAVLKLDPPPPADLHPAWLQELDHVDSQRVRTAGFPTGYALGRHAQGRLEGTDAGGWLQAISSLGEMTFLPGHSGAPVFLDGSGTVIAMVAMTDESRRDVALLIPTALMRRAWPTLGEPSADILARNPYRGLDIFRAEHRALFKGRDCYVTKISQRLDERRLVAIIGASGSGKSSQALAGIMPARSDAGWITADFRPRDDPFRNLAAGLVPHLEPSLSEPGPVWEAAGRYTDQFRSSPEEFLSLVRHVVDRARVRGLLVLIDQFEELFTQTPASVRTRFLELLNSACASRESTVAWLLTVRADFLEQALGDEGGPLPALLQDADIMLGPMNEAELRQAIELPAQAEGVQFARGLVERLIADAVGRPSETTTTDQEASRRSGRLPLLEFALEALWRKQQAGEISHAAYDDPVAGIGGLDGALRRHAEAVYRELGKSIDGPARQERARRLFRRLVQRRQGGDDIRRAVPKTEIEQDWNDLVVALADARLVTTSEPSPGHAIVEVIHEELLRAWSDLAGWISENREFDLWREDLNVAASRWHVAPESEKVDLLLRGRQLDKALVNLRERQSELNPIEISFVEAGQQRTEKERADREKIEHRKLRNTRIVAIAMTALAIAAGVLGVISYEVWRGSRERLAGSRLLEAQAALRRHDIGSAIVSFGAAIDNLSTSDPRASSAFAGIVANVASAPRVLNSFGEAWGAALSVNADKVLVRRSTGRVEVFDGSTGRSLPAPDVGLLQNDFQWMNFMDRYPVQLSADGSIASLIFPAEGFSIGAERTRPWLFNIAVWRPGSADLIWKAQGADLFGTHGPHDYLLLRGQGETQQIVRTLDGPAAVLRLTGGSVVEGFPPTGEAYIVWRTGTPGNIQLALVDVDKIPSGYGGRVPEGAVVWAHQLPAYFGDVQWQGYPGKPAFVTRAAQAPTWYCDSTSCRQITSQDYTLVTYADPPTQGARPLDEQLASLLHVDLKKIWPWGDTAWGTAWAQGPNANTIAFFSSDGLHVRDLYTGAEQAPRDLGSSNISSAWSRDGRHLWVMNKDGQLVSVPIRVFTWSSPPTKPPGQYEGWTEMTLPPAGDRTLTITGIFRSGHVRIRSAPIGVNVTGRPTWELTLPSDEIRTHARFTRDGKRVIVEESKVTDESATGRVRILAAETGDDLGHFDTAGWMLQGDAWIGERGRLAAVSKFPGNGQQIFAVCEWSESGLSRCSKPLETLAEITQDGAFFVERRAYRTSVYASSDLTEHQQPVFEIAGTRSRSRFDRALLEFLVLSSESLTVSAGAEEKQIMVHRHGATFSGTYSSDGHFIVRVGGQEFRFPSNSFDGQIDARWGPEMRVLALSSDGRRMAVDVSGHGAGEVWDLTTGTVLAVLPLETPDVTFSSDNESLVEATASGEIELCYLGPENARPRPWATEAALMAFIRGHEVGDWKTGGNMLRAIDAAGRGGDKLSDRVARMLSEAWDQ
jgi:hypothetical protein